jgi:endonuclease/exonuclease/phosphatase family metal-dependent hydrolase
MMKTSWVSRCARWASRTCEVFVVVYAVALYARWGAGLLFGDAWWLLALANTFAVYLFVPMPVAALVALIARNRAAGLAVLAGGALFAALYWPQLVPRYAEQPSGEVIRVMTFNAPFPAYGSDSAAQRAVAHIGGREVVLVNAHPTASAGIAHWQDLPAYVSATYARREREVAEVCVALRGETRPVILAGDMNATEQSAVYGLLAQRLGDSWREAGVGFGHTFPAPVFRMADVPFPAPEWLKSPGGLLDRPTPGGLVRLDYIFHSNELRAAGVRVVNVGQSDHLAVVAEFAWRQ